MPTVVATVRPDDVDIALVVHVLGAMVLVGGLFTAAAAGIAGWRDEAADLRRFSYKTLLAVALPGYIVMRIGAEWVYAEEGWNDLPEGVDEPAWLLVGYITSDLGALLMLLALILGGVGLRRSRSGRGDALLKTSSVLATVLVAVYVVAVWAMGAKPS